VKKLIIITLVAVSFVGICHAQQNPIYKAGYSSNFTMADQAYADKILTVLKDFENNTLDNHIGWFADTVTMTLASGNVLKGKTENLNGAKQFRGSISNYKVSLDAIVNLKSVDRDQNVVCVWTTEEYTGSDGKKVKESLQEVWGFNKDGKIDLMIQYAQAGGSM
jgi:hypothetical protein